MLDNKAKLTCQVDVNTGNEISSTTTISKQLKMNNYKLKLAGKRVAGVTTNNHLSTYHYYSLHLSIEKIKSGKIS